MIYTESKKLHLIEVLLKEKDDEVLKQVEKVLTASTNKSSSKFNNFSNRLSEKELDEFERNIEDGCEQINENDWK